MRTLLLSEAISRLQLRPDAPYPSQELKLKEEAQDARDMVKKWRAEQRMYLCRTNDRRNDER